MKGKDKMRKTISILLITVMIVSALFALNVSAELVKKTVGYLTFADYETFCELISCDKSASGIIEIPSDVDFGGKTLSVTGISDQAFSGCKEIIGVSIPDSVTSIGSYAFIHCTNLVSVKIPDGVTRINDYTFRDCSTLFTVILPKSVKSIGRLAFYGCDNLSVIYYGGSEEEWNNISVDVDNDVLSDAVMIYNYDPSNIETKVGYLTFYNNGLDCGLTDCDESAEGEINIPSSVIFNGNSLPVKSIGSYAFDDCYEITKVTMPDTITEIGSSAFKNCENLESVTLSKGITEISESTFEGCISLKSITIPDGVTSIGDCAFFACDSLESVTIPVSVTSINIDAFAYCDSLKTVYYKGSEKDWYSIVYIGEGNQSLLYAEIIFEGVDTSTEKGDINGDGSVDNKDVVLLFRYASASDAYDPLYDYNDDGAVDNKDVVALFRFVSSAK